MMNKKNGYVLTFSGMLIYLHTQGALCDLLLLLSTNLNQMMWKKTFPFLARVFHHCLLVLRARRKSCKRCCCRVVSSCKLTFSLLSLVGVFKMERLSQSMCACICIDLSFTDTAPKCIWQQYNSKKRKRPEEEFFLLLPVWMKENNKLLPKNGVTG